MKKIFQYIIAAFLTFSVGELGSIFTFQTPTWYDSLEKPLLTPPSWTFAPAWTLMYALLAIALVQIWNTEHSEEKVRWLGVFIAQLGCNIAWSILFFQLHGLLLSWIVLLFLWFLVLMLVVEARNLDRLTFWLMLPYLGWVTYAFVLNMGIWWIN